VNGLTLRVPRGFDFWRTVLSHGWAVLPPFECDPPQRTLRRTFRFQSGRLATATMHGTTSAVQIDTGRTVLTAEERTDLRCQVQTCLRLDEDFSEFHAAARRHAGYRWIATSGAGRLLRAPTLYEDVVKMICTTNCSWSLTEAMVGKLVRLFGAESDEGRRAFPEPRSIAESTEQALRARCSMGYRAPYVLELSRRVASGELALEALRSSTAPAPELFETLRAIKGVGPYAAGNLLKLLGRYDHLALDAWVRGQYAKLHTRGRAVKDTTIERRYAPLGRWRGLFFWLEMTRSWHHEKFRGSGGGLPL
jgi:3-methyladenine DNA glycosylase/8-oxoguanine DNA glycosylase